MTTFQKGDRIRVRQGGSVIYSGQTGIVDAGPDSTGRSPVCLDDRKSIDGHPLRLWFNAEELELLKGVAHVTTFNTGDAVRVRLNVSSAHRGKTGYIHSERGVHPDRWPVCLYKGVPGKSRDQVLWFDTDDLELVTPAPQPETVTVSTFNTDGAISRTGKNPSRTPEEIRAWAAVEALVPILKDPELKECALRPVRAALYSLVLEAVAAGTPDAAELAAEALGRP